MRTLSARVEGAPDAGQPVVQVGNPADAAGADVDDVEIAQVGIEGHHVADAKLDIHAEGAGLLPANADVGGRDVDTNHPRSQGCHRDALVADRAGEMQDALPVEVAEEVQFFRIEGALSRPVLIQGHAWPVFRHRLPPTCVATDGFCVCLVRQRGSPACSERRSCNRGCRCVSERFTVTGRTQIPPSARHW